MMLSFSRCPQNVPLPSLPPVVAYRSNSWGKLSNSGSAKSLQDKALVHEFCSNLVKFLTLLYR
ncbi:hypothetical protein ACP70R_041829 [Stipagrostis hirtigluma subsp. patula]